MGIDFDPKEPYAELERLRKEFGEPDIDGGMDSDILSAIYCPIHTDHIIYSTPAKWKDKGQCCFGGCFGSGGLHQIGIKVRCDKCDKDYKVLFESYGG